MAYTVKELVTKYRLTEVETKPPEAVTTASDAIPLLQELLGNNVQETLGILAIDPQFHVLGFKVLSIGTMDAVQCHPRDVFQSLVLMNASRFIMAHNHPVGNNLPSLPDIRITQSLRKAGEIMGIPLMEHFVVNALSAVAVTDFCTANSIHENSSDSEIMAKLMVLVQESESVFFKGVQPQVDFNQAISIVFQKALDSIPSIEEGEAA